MQVGQKVTAQSPTRTNMARIAMLGIYSVAIFYLGTRRAMKFPGDRILSFDKMLHAVVFGGLGVLGYRWFKHRWPGLRSQSVWALSVGLAAVLGALLEVVQAQLPYRTMEFGDLVADILGAAMCVACAERFRLERPIGWL